MRKVVISSAVEYRMAELDTFLTQEYRMSRTAVNARIKRMDDFVASLGNKTADYALCRFKRWRKLGYRCVPFEGRVFACELFDEGIIIHDMAHAATLHDTD